MEFKLDGARLQIHRHGDEVRLYSRHLADVTPSLPDVAAEVKEKLAAQEAIPVQLHLFDALYVNGKMLVDASYAARWTALAAAAGGLSLVRRLIPQTLDKGQGLR